MTTLPPLRFGIIGTGRIAVDAHIPDIRRTGGTVVALADVVPGRAARFAAALDVPHAFDDWRELLARDDLDAVAIASPVKAHEENACAAFAAGKHVFLEKPPAHSAEAMRRITAAGHAAGRLLLVGSQSVYHQAIRRSRAVIERGDLGRVYLVHARSCERWGIPHGWIRRKEHAIGGPGIDGNAHLLDRVLYLLGNPRPVSVVARTYNAFPTAPATSDYYDMDFAEGRSCDEPKDVEDTAVYLVQFADGMSMVAEVTKAAHMAGGAGTWIYGDRAGLTLEPPTRFSRNGANRPVDTPLEIPEERRGHEQAFAHLIACIREGRAQTDSPGERAVTIMQIIDALYASAERGGEQVRIA
jgi:predicted dehydrogenase